MDAGHEELPAYQERPGPEWLPLVARDWNSSISVTLWRHPSVHFISEVDEPAIIVFGRFLKCLGVARRSTLSLVESLELDSIEVPVYSNHSDSWLFKVLSLLPNLRYVNLSNEELMTGSIRHLQGYSFPAVETVRMNNLSNLSRHHVAQLLKTLPNLSEVDLSDTIDVDDKVLSYISARKVTVRGCRNVTDKGLANLLDNSRSNLEIDLGSTNVSDTGLELLICRTNSMPPGYDENAVAVQRLGVSNSKVSLFPGVATFLGAHPGLQGLDIGGLAHPSHEQFFESLKSLISLRYLRLDYTLLVLMLKSLSVSMMQHAELLVLSAIPSRATRDLDIPWLANFLLVECKRCSSLRSVILQLDELEYNYEMDMFMDESRREETCDTVIALHQHKAKLLQEGASIWLGKINIVRLVGGISGAESWLMDWSGI